jgi:hypothetical protein
MMTNEAAVTIQADGQQAQLSCSAKLFPALRGNLYPAQDHVCKVHHEDINKQRYMPEGNAGIPHIFSERIHIRFSV